MTPPRFASRCLAIVALGSTGIACSESGTVSESVTVQDSAGVEIVSSTAPAWPQGMGWTVGPEPDLVIGRDEGDGRYLLADVRAVRRLPDGRIAVLDAGAGRVRIYGANGVWDRDIGGLGQAPGGFTAPLYLDVIANSLVIYENGPPRVTRFDLEGNLMGVAEFTPAPAGAGARATVFGVAEPRWLVAHEPLQDRQLAEGVNRIPLRLIRFDLRELRARALALVPGREVNVTFPDGVLTQMVHIFGHATHMAASGSSIYVGSTDDYSIRVLDPDGTLHRIIRRPVPARATSAAARARFVTTRMAQFDLSQAQREIWQADLDSTTMSETMPAFRYLAADDQGHLWVEAWDDVGLGQGDFSIFDADGVWLGDVSVPAGLIESRGGLREPSFDIGDRYLLGVWEDDRGTQQVRSYPIDKAAR